MNRKQLLIGNQTKPHKLNMQAGSEFISKIIIKIINIFQNIDNKL